MILRTHLIVNAALARLSPPKSRMHRVFAPALRLLLSKGLQLDRRRTMPALRHCRAHMPARVVVV